MKTLTLKSSVLVAAFSLLVVFSYSQGRYGHLKRVKTKKTEIEQPAATKMTPGKVENKTVTSEHFSNKENVTVENNYIAPEHDAVASTNSGEVAKSKVDSKVRVKAVTKTKASKEKTGLFTQKFQKQHKVWDIEKVKKANLETWLLIMIILFAAAVLFLILAIVFAFAVGSFGLYVVFYILAALCFIGGGVVLVLGLTGVM